MVQVSRKEHESSTALIRRFTRRVQRAGIIIEARKQRFHIGNINKTTKRRAAKRREEKKQEFDELYKLGKLDEPHR